MSYLFNDMAMRMRLDTYLFKGELELIDNIYYYILNMCVCNKQQITSGVVLSN